MSTIWLYTLGSVGLVSLVSLIGVFALGFKHEKLQRILQYLVSFSVGAFLGEIFLHLLPEMAEVGFGVTEGAFLLIGVLVFFVLERGILWHHSHGEHEEKVHSVAYLTIFGDALHNFIDGIVIAASFLVSTELGIATTVAVLFHEIPHEIGDYAILVHGGWSRAKALWYNFLSALTAILGAIVVLVFARGLEEAPTVLLALAGSSFLYIAMTDLIPELHKERGVGKFVGQFICIVLGAVAMASLLLLE